MPLFKRYGLDYFSRIIWSYKQWFIKKVIYWQDKLGLLSYTCKSQLIKETIDISSSRIVIFFLPFGDEDEQIQALLEQTNPYWNAIIKRSYSFSNDPRIKTIPYLFEQSVEELQKIIQTLIGDWVVLLHPGDIPEPTFVQFIQSVDSDSKIIYWDVDFERDGKITPWFKPDWSPDLQISAPLLQSCAIQRELLLQSCAKCLDDQPISWLQLAMLAATTTVSIQHVPQVLMHSGKPIPSHEFLNVIEGFCHTVHPQATAKLEENNRIRVTWPVNPELVSIIIPTRENRILLNQCLESLVGKTSYHPYEIILMDDHSNDPDLLLWYLELEKLPNVHVHHNQEPFNYNRVNNEGTRLAKGSLLLFLNNDIEIIQPDWLEEMVRWAQRPEIGMVGAQLLYPDQTIQHNGIYLGLVGHANHLFLHQSPEVSTIFGSPRWIRNVSAVTGACMMMRRKVFEEIGGFDEVYQLVFSDVEICLRAIQKGYRNVVTPYAQLIHYEGKSRAHRIPAADISRASLHLRSWIARGDPYFNPNLSCAVTFPTLHRPFEPNPVDRLDQITRYMGNEGKNT